MSMIWPDPGEPFVWSVPDGSTKVLLGGVEGDDDREVPYIHFYVWGDRTADVLEMMDSVRMQLKLEDPA
jgi:hypothetical protein